MRNFQPELGEGAETNSAGIGRSSLHDNDAGASGIAPSGMFHVPPRSVRWIPHRKAEIVAAVRCGHISLDDACARYSLSIEEFLSWQQGIDRFGLSGLCVNKTQQRRRVRSKTRPSGEEPHGDGASAPADTG